MPYKYTDAYKSIKAPDELRTKILNSTTRKKQFNLKPLISVAACVIILAAIIPTYVGFTDPDVTVAQVAVIAQRQAGTRINLDLDLDRTGVISVSEGTLEGYNGEKVKGNIQLIWDLGNADYKDCTLTLKDAFKTTEYALDYNENNGSWSIIKN
ncbi:MAG: hypothetical protein IKT46_05570 [Clostridia bacterium]|nr:hypothetical protein [Clostridia bacterium]